MPGTTVPGHADRTPAVHDTGGHGVGGVTQMPAIGPHVGGFVAWHMRVGMPTRPFRHWPVVDWPSAVATHDASASFTGGQLATSQGLAITLHEPSTLHVRVGVPT